MNRILLALSLLLPLLAQTAQASELQLQLQLELGAVWQNRNDVRIPPIGGTYLEFDKFNKGPFFHYRTEFFYRFGGRHTVRALLAPFSTSVTGKPTTTVDYNGATFAADQDLTVNYKFNSYRLTYAYRTWSAGRSYFDFGVTGKIRDAKIEMVQGSTRKDYKNVGFVPLLYFEYNQSLASTWSLHASMDAAAAKPGRAIDAAIKVRHDLNKNSQAGIGVRTLEGGADNDKVFTWSWFNYAVADFVYAF